MPATPIGPGVTNYLPSGSTSTIHFGNVLTGDIIAVITGSFFQTSYWTVRDNLGNGEDLDNFNAPIYAKGAWQFHPGGKIGAFWAISLIDGDLSVTVETSTDPRGGTPVVENQLTIVRVYRFPKVYAIDQSSVGLEGFGFDPGPGFNSAEGTGPVTFADTLVVTGVITINDLGDLTSLTGDTVQNQVDKPFGPGPFDQENSLYCLDRSVTGPGNGNVQIKYNCGQGTVGTSIVVMTFSVPLPRPPGLTRQYAARGGTGQDNNPGIIDGDQQTSILLAPLIPYGYVDGGMNRPIVCTFPYEVAVGDLLFIDLIVPLRNASSIQIWDEYGEGFPVLPPPYVNDYIQRIICPPTGSGQILASGYLAIYTCEVKYIPVQAHPGWEAGGIFQVHLQVDPAGSSAPYQITALGCTALTITGHPRSYAVAGLKSITQVGDDALLATDTIFNVKKRTYLHAFAAYGGGGTLETMTWTEMEDYVIPDEAHWDFFQFPGTITNQPRIHGLAIMDKIAPADGDYDAQVTAELAAYAGGGGILLIAVEVRIGHFPQKPLQKINRHLVPGL